MATFLPKRQGISQSEALAEAYAHDISSVPALTTISLYHAAFEDEYGRRTAVYAVQDYEPLEATIEIDATTFDAGSTVIFQPVAFEFTRPPESDSQQAPSVQLKVDGVAKHLMPHLKAASQSQTPILMVVRTYMANDTSEPHEKPPMRLILRNVSCDKTSVTATASYADLINQKFPRVTYTRENHPGLVAG